MPMRRLIIEQKSEGKTLAAISECYHLSYTTVCRVYRRYKEEGASGLLPHYNRCGHHPFSPHRALLRRAALWLKRLHPLWGAAFIRLQLQKRYRCKLPCERTLQRWFQNTGLQPRKPRTLFPHSMPARAVHDVWQIDAKEKLRLRTATKVCYLSVVDQKSGSLLGSFVFPPLPHQ
jgi:transposase